MNNEINDTFNDPFVQSVPEINRVEIINSSEDLCGSGIEDIQKESVINSEEKTFTKPEPNVFDVAAYVLKLTGRITAMKLQKLVYYCQAWSLVWDEAPLFSEKIEAWANGPVIRDLFNYHRGLYYLDVIPIGNPDLLNEKQKETVKAVVDYYGAMKSQQLIDLTHLETPWKNARMELSAAERGNIEIKISDIADYYSSL